MAAHSPDGLRFTECLKQMLTRANLLIVGVILAAGAVTGFLMLRQNRMPSQSYQTRGPADNAPAPPSAGKTGRARPIEPAAESESGFHESDGAPDGHGHIADEERHRQTLTKIRDFQADVLGLTHAEQVRVETPELINTPAPGADHGFAAGYVAFMAGPEAMNQGVYHTMADIARLYFNRFPDAPRVTVALIIGGGVRDRETFFNSGDAKVRPGGADP